MKRKIRVHFAKPHAPTPVQLSLLMRHLPMFSRVFQSDSVVLDRCFSNTLDRAERFEKLQLSLVTDQRDLGQLGREIPFFASFAVKLDGGFMRFLADLQYQPKGQ